MDEAPSEGVAEPGPEPPAGDTAVEAVEQPDDGNVEPSRQYVEVDDPDNRWVRVKIDGEETEVPFSEAVKGYSREAHFTRNMQAVAQQRQENEYAINLQRALNANPEMTLQILAQQYGLQQQGQQAPADEEPEYTDPLERQLAEERRAREDLERRISQRETDEQLERAVTGLRQQFNLNDDDLREVIGTAYQSGYGIEVLPMIYKSMAFDRLAARVQAQRDRTAAEEAERSRRTAAKTQAGAVVANGSRGAGGLTNQVDAGGRMSLRDAIEAAFEQAERG
jgi:hypothetical protein